MSGVHDTFLVARREVRERARSTGFRIGLVVMVAAVVAVIAVPALIGDGAITRKVGVTGETGGGLAAALVAQGDGADVTVEVSEFTTGEAGEDAVRSRDVDVLIVDGEVLVWRGPPDERLRAVATTAIHLVAIEQRAEALGIDPEDLRTVLQPVPVEDVQLGLTPGTSPDDESAAMVMAILLLAAISTYGNLVLTGVVEEKSSRVVEVLLARIPARSLLAGKVIGIGLLGVAQFAIAAVAALLTTMVVSDVDLPAVRGSVLTWVVVWFVLGYATYAIAYGALGSLASRSEDAQSVAAPLVVVLLAAFWGSFVALGRDPDSAVSVALSLFPGTAPFAMPARLALGVAAWWEPIVAVLFSLASIAGLVIAAGRVYSGAILRRGPRLTLRDVWAAAGPDTPHPR